jgi:hypothetical protein
MNKRSFLLIAALSLVAITAGTGTASDWATSDGSCYAQGDKIGSAGLSVYYFGLYAAFDYGIHDAISIGGGLGYNGYSPTLSWRYNYLPIMIRGAFHPFNLAAIADKIAARNMVDVYIGLATGWQIGWATWNNDGEPIGTREPGGFVIREYIGARYFFSDKVALFLEHCPGLTNIAAGVSYKF